MCVFNAWVSPFVATFTLISVYRIMKTCIFIYFVTIISVTFSKILSTLTWKAYRTDGDIDSLHIWRTLTE